MIARDAVERSLAAIERSEPLIRAWTVVEADRARAEADAVDARLRQGEHLPLAGVTVGVKDIYDVAGLATVAGFAPFANRRATRDADIVTALRHAGAVIVGKTTTTQFASSDPTETRNPWHLERTPGGSSSGSAAAVAAGHVDLTLGSQTGGSTLRPASFCGAVGFKPAFGWFPRGGMVPLARSLDTIGLIGPTVAGVAHVYGTLTDEPPDEPEGDTPRLAHWTDATQLAIDEVRDATTRAVARIASEVGEISASGLDASYRDLRAVHQIVMLTEAAAAHRRLHSRYPEHYAPGIRAFVETGMAIPAAMYARALALRDHFRAQAAERWSDIDAILLPTADTTAVPRETTGNPALQAVATLLGLPALSLPIGLDAAGLPLGLQLLSPRPSGARRLLAVARQLEALFSPLHPPSGSARNRPAQP